MSVGPLALAHGAHRIAAASASIAATRTFDVECVGWTGRIEEGP